MLKKLLFSFLILFVIGGTAIAFTYNWTIDAFEYSTDEISQAAYVSSDTDAVPTSEYSSDSYTKLLLHCNGADESTTFTDSGNTGHTVTAVGTAQLDTAQKKFGTASGLFDTGGNYLTVPDSVDWDFGTGPYTIDFWMRIPSNGGSRVLSSDAAYGHLVTASSTHVSYEVGDTGSGWAASMDVEVNIPINTWVHCAIVREGTGTNELKIYVGGILEASGTYSTNSADANVTELCIATMGWGLTQSFDGWLDEFRISKGIARWTHDFDVPAYQSYSESTIIQQGTYSLKVVAAQTDSLNDTLTRTLTDQKDLSNTEGIEYDIYALRTGSNVKIGLHDSGGTTSEHTANVISSNTNQTESWDVSGIADADKDDIDQIIVTIVNADAANTFYLDDSKAGLTPAAGGSWGFVQ